MRTNLDQRHKAENNLLVCELWETEKGFWAKEWRSRCILNDAWWFHQAAKVTKVASVWKKSVQNVADAKKKKMYLGSGEKSLGAAECIKYI